MPRPLFVFVSPALSLSVHRTRFAALPRAHRVVEALHIEPDRERFVCRDGVGYATLNGSTSARSLFSSTTDECSTRPTFYE